MNYMYMQYFTCIQCTCTIQVHGQLKQKEEGEEKGKYALLSMHSHVQYLMCKMYDTTQHTLSVDGSIWLTGSSIYSVQCIILRTMYMYVYILCMYLLTVITVHVCVQKADLLYWPLKLPSGGLASDGTTYTVCSIVHVCVCSADSQQPPGGGEAAGVGGGGGGGGVGKWRRESTSCDV